MVYAKVTIFPILLLFSFVEFTALTLLVGHQEEHPACKNVKI